MGIVHRAVVDTPIDEVFDWHARPGAIHRLVPPWQPLRVLAEASSLRDGRAILGLPGGIRWAAQHDPAAFDPPHRFVDHLDSTPLRALLHWRHDHRFVDLGAATAVLDRVQTEVPESLLSATFGYRTRQLADDLAALRRAAEPGARPKTIAVSGSSGTVGSALVPFLTTAGHRVIRLVRHEPRGSDQRRWDPAEPAGGLLDGVDAVVHLAGAGIAGRFTDAHRRAVRDSRMEPTRRLARLAADAGVSAFVCASAIGFYGPDTGDRPLAEDAPAGDGFLADLVAGWEEAATAARTSTTRVVQVRTGLVQTPRGGLLQLQRPLFAAGLGGRIGTGEGWLSWIGIDDLTDIYHLAVVDPRMAGPINAVAPTPVRGKEFAATLGAVLHRPSVFAVPVPALELVLGSQGAHEFALASQRISPAALTELGHRFRWPALEPALRHLLGRPIPATG